MQHSFPAGIRPGHGARALLAAAIGLILLATLTPFPGQPTLPVSWCLACGERGGADALANVLLFLPLGIACALLGVRALAAIGGAALLSITIETIQFALPGRDPSLSDVVSNTAGIALGFYSTVAVLQLRERSLPPWLATMGSICFLAVVALTGALLRPLPPPGEYWGQWTARLGHLGAYDGQVLSASLGEVALPSHRLADSRLVAFLLAAGAPLEVRGVAGPPPPRLAPVFSMFTGDQREVLLLGFDGTDLVYRLRTASQALRLDAPDVRVRGAGAGIPAGSALKLRVERETAGRCLLVNARRYCGLGFTAGRLWAVVHYDTRLGGAIATLLDALCVGLLLLPVGLTLRRDAWGAASLVLAAAALFLLPPWVGLLRASLAETAAAGATLFLPGLLAAYRRRRDAGPSSAPTVSTRANSATQRSMRV